jgi:hypothetical protein
VSFERVFQAEDAESVPGYSASQQLGEGRSSARASPGLKALSSKRPDARLKPGSFTVALRAMRDGAACRVCPEHACATCPGLKALSSRRPDARLKPGSFTVALRAMKDGATCRRSPRDVRGSLNGTEVIFRCRRDGDRVGPWIRLRTALSLSRPTQRGGDASFRSQQTRSCFSVF